jgi:hypothetical protein
MLLESEGYGGADMDRERKNLIVQFLDGDAKAWLLREVEHPNRHRPSWTFDEVITGLYDRFVHATSLGDSRKAFSQARFNPEKGVRAFYDDLTTHAQNMSVYPDQYLVLETFLNGLPDTLRRVLFLDCHLSPEINTVEEFLAEAIEWEHNQHNYKHYGTHGGPGVRSQENREMYLGPRKIGKILVKRSSLDPNRKSPGVFIKPREVVKVVDKRPAFNKPRPKPEVNRPKGAEPQPPRRDTNGGCHNCGSKDHWVRDCPKRTDHPAPITTTNASLYALLIRRCQTLTPMNLRNKLKLKSWMSWRTLIKGQTMNPSHLI